MTGYRESWTGKVPTVTYDLDAKAVRDSLRGQTYGALARAYTDYGSIESTNSTYEGVYNALPSKKG